MLGEGLGGPCERLVGGLPVARAVSPLGAARAVAEFRPEVIVLCGEGKWQREFVRRIPPARRPGILDVSNAPCPEADEWLAPDRIGEEGTRRLARAAESGRCRRVAERKALTDSLTGLPNRRAVIQGLVHQSRLARREGTSASLVLIDLDHFKAVNEANGHAAGDALLRRVGGVLRGLTRSGELCGRIGGDEFAMVVAGGLADARRAARRATASLRSIGVPASAGVSTWNPPERLMDLYRRTDALLGAMKARRQHGSRGAPPASVAA